MAELMGLPLDLGGSDEDEFLRKARELASMANLRVICPRCDRESNGPGPITGIFFRICPDCQKGE
jgi:hypothetical protein